MSEEPKYKDTTKCFSGLTFKVEGVLLAEGEFGEFIVFKFGNPETPDYITSSKRVIKKFKENKFSSNDTLTFFRAGIFMGKDILDCKVETQTELNFEPANDVNVE